jgi:hypothetical protein
VAWKLTIRHASEVERESFDDLDGTIAEARSRVDEVLSEGRMGTVRMLREFTPDQRVHARIELTGSGLLRRRSGGVDVMGDGAVIAYTGAIRKEEIEAETLDEAFQRLREELDS